MENETNGHDGEAKGHNGFSDPDWNPPPDCSETNVIKESKGIEPLLDEVRYDLSRPGRQSGRFGHDQLQAGIKQPGTNSSRYEGPQTINDTADARRKPVHSCDDLKVFAFPCGEHGAQKPDPQCEMLEIFYCT